MNVYVDHVLGPIFFSSSPTHFCLLFLFRSGVRMVVGDSGAISIVSVGADCEVCLVRFEEAEGGKVSS